MDYGFGSLIVEETADNWLLRYIFYGEPGSEQVHLALRLNKTESTVPSISRIIHAADWQEREARDLFGLVFEGHPRLENIVRHEEWPEEVHPMRHSFEASQPYPHRQIDPAWRLNGVVKAPGVFMMPIGPVYADVAEPALFLLESVGEDLIRTAPRFFYKFRGVEKIAEGQPVDRVLLLAERFSATSALAHSLAFCQAVETIGQIEIPARAQALRVVLAEDDLHGHGIF
jgi:formate hydrogenlyase subunit 5